MSWGSHAKYLCLCYPFSSLLSALQIVHGALAYFAVSNRDKLYVYREHTEGSSNSSIFYLRVFESLCSTGGGSLIGSTLTSRGMCARYIVCMQCHGSSTHKAILAGYWYVFFCEWCSSIVAPVRFWLVFFDFISSSYVSH